MTQTEVLGASGHISHATSAIFTSPRYGVAVTGAATDSADSAGITRNAYVSHDGARCASGPSSAPPPEGPLSRRRAGGASVARKGADNLIQVLGAP